MRPLIALVLAFAASTAIAAPRKPAKISLAKPASAKKAAPAKAGPEKAPAKQTAQASAIAHDTLAGMQRGFLEGRTDGGDNIEFKPRLATFKPFSGKHFPPEHIQIAGKRYEVFVGSEPSLWGAAPFKSINEAQRFILRDMATGEFTREVPIKRWQKAFVN